MIKTTIPANMPANNDGQTTLSKSSVTITKAANPKISDKITIFIQGFIFDF